MAVKAGHGELRWRRLLQKAVGVNKLDEHRVEADTIACGPVAGFFTGEIIRGIIGHRIKEKSW